VSTSLTRPQWLARAAFATLAGAAFMASVAMPARAGMGPGSALFGYYNTTQNPADAPSTTGTNGTGTGDNILRLIDPIGSANSYIAPQVNLCAMIYVFDDNEEMGECCGCPLTPTQLETFSVDHDLTSNWTLQGGALGDGVIAIRVAVQNNPNCVSPNPPFFGQPDTSPACNGGCDPKSGFDLQPTLFGSMTKVQTIGAQTVLTENPLFDDATGDFNNQVYLVEQCSELVGNSTGAGICHCPIPGNLIE
jgi:hypothetical protein